MNDYLALLTEIERLESGTKTPEGSLTKPTEGAFVSSVGVLPGHSDDESQRQSSRQEHRPSRSLHLLCAGCKCFFMHEPATLCYWCRAKRDRRPAGEPCEGCGEGCEHCLGDPLIEDGR